MSDIAGMRAELCRLLREAGHDARIHPDNGAVVIPLRGRWWRVVGGDAQHPSLIEEPTPSREPEWKR